MTVYKYELRHPSCEVDMPFGAQILKVAFQENKLMLWAKVDPTQHIFKRRFVSVYTGGAVKEEAQYLETVTYKGIVYHIFEETP